MIGLVCCLSQARRSSALWVTWLMSISSPTLTRFWKTSKNSFVDYSFPHKWASIYLFLMKWRLCQCYDLNHSLLVINGYEMNLPCISCMSFQIPKSRFHFIISNEYLITSYKLIFVLKVYMIIAVSKQQSLIHIYQHPTVKDNIVRYFCIRFKSRVTNWE